MFLIFAKATSVTQCLPMRLFRFFFLLSLLCLVMFSCSQQNTEELFETNTTKSTSSQISVRDRPQNPADSLEGDDSNYTVSLSNTGDISIDQETFSEMIDLNEDGQCFDKKTGNFLDGRYRLLSPNGILLSSTAFRSGFYHGEKQEFHENGIVSVSSNYLFGKKNGKEQWNSDGGMKIYEAHFRLGSLEGMETAWNEEGEVLSRYLFQGGKMVERFVENGVVVGK